VYEFLRNSALDARNYFDAGTIPPFKRNQFGGAIGGPILKNRTFFFADYEGIRQTKGITSFTTVPSLAARAGQLCSIPLGDPSNPARPRSSPRPEHRRKWRRLVGESLFAILASPNGPILGNGDVGVFTFAGQQAVHENFFTTRLDHKFSDTDSLFGTYVYDKTPYSSPDGLNNVQFDTLTSRQILSIEETHIFAPSFANSIRIGGNHEAVNNNESQRAINPDATLTALGSFGGRAAAQVFASPVSPSQGGGREPDLFLSLEFGAVVRRCFPHQRHPFHPFRRSRGTSAA